MRIVSMLPMSVLRVLAGLLLVGLSSASAPEPGTLQQVRDLIQDGRYAEAENGARLLLARVEATIGSDSLEAARVIDILVESLWRGGKAKDPAVRAFAERAVRIKTELLGQEHTEMAGSLGNLAQVVRFQGDFAGAKQLFERGLTIREKILGPDHLEVASSLHDLAGLLLETQNSTGAKLLYERALAIREARLGPSHPDVGWTLGNLARVLRAMGEFREARSIFDRSLTILEKAVRPDHPGVASVLNGLAVLLDETGDYVAAKPAYERTLAIWESSLGPDHPRTASTLNNLALLLGNMGDFSGAKRLYERALQIKEKALPDHPQVATGLNNLADLYVRMGDHDGARPLYERSLAIRKKVFGDRHPHVASSLHNLAALLHQMRDRASARHLYELALGIWEETPDSDQRDIARTLGSLASLLQETGDRAAARSLHERSLAIRRKILGPEAPEVAESLHSLADLLRESGQLDEARSRYEGALAIREKVLGSDHPLVAQSLDGLAEVLWETGKVSDAFDASLRAEEIGRNHLRLTTRSLSERQALRYSAVRPSSLDLAISMAVSAGDVILEAVPRAWDSLLRSRALVLDEMADRQRVTDDTESVELSLLIKQLASARTRLANLVVRGPDPAHPGGFRSLVAEARRQEEEAEQALAEKTLSLKGKLVQTEVSLAQVAGDLPSATALVAFARYNSHAGPGHRQRGPRAPVPSYAAFVILAGSDEPLLVPLGEADEIETLVARWTEEASRGSLLSWRSPVEAESAYRIAASRLGDRIWTPLPLSGVKTVFVVPEGALHMVNLSALPSGTRTYLIENGPLIHYLSAERDLSRHKTRSHLGRGLMAVGGPSFDLTSSPVMPGSSPEDRKRDTSSDNGYPSRGERFACADFQSMHFDPLPAAVLEAQEVVRLWESGGPRSRSVAESQAGQPPERDAAALLLTGAEATEARFKREAPGRLILHLATHGFFLTGECHPTGAGSRGISLVSSAEGQTPQSLALGNPLLRSGLALAGANRRAEAGPDEEDGILTAAEIAAMNLSDVEWAVLSACDTAKGETKAGEGVFGLRRAFELAGVGTLIMSLWEVEDATAQEWMTALYRARTATGPQTGEAVRQAGLHMLRQRREAGGTGHPFSWAGFVAAGDWR